MKLHTPGTWRAERMGPISSAVRIYSPKAFRIVPTNGHEATGPAFAYLPEGRDDVQAANAALIEAAPALLAALERLHAVADGAGWLRKSGDALSQAEAALSQAKGGAR